MAEKNEFPVCECPFASEREDDFELYASLIWEGESDEAFEKCPEVAAHLRHCSVCRTWLEYLLKVFDQDEEAEEFWEDG